MKLTELTDMMDSAEPGALARMEQAWQWLCEQRSAAPDEADVWDIRWQHMSTGPAWLSDLLCRIMASRYRLSPVILVGKDDGRKAVWGAQDALVLKWVALSLQSLLPLHPACEHVKGHGGGKASVKKLHGLLAGAVEKKTADEAGPQDGVSGDEVNGRGPDIREYRWVCRTDIRGYYRNINKQTLLNQVRQHVQSPVLRDLVAQYVHYTVEDGGTFHTPEKGISRGCPLSPLMGALHLYEMDAHFAAQKHIYYARYMDDVIILAKSRWQLRRHVKRLMQWFRAEGFEAHPDKTHIGRTEKGFDWMGAWLTDAGVVDIAPRAKANHREKVRRLYERLARVPLWRRKRARQQVNARVSTYRKRWNIWAGALLTVAGAACADSPIVILTSGNVAGDTGARYPFSASFEVGAADPAYDRGGLCISPMLGGSCMTMGWSNDFRQRNTPLGWGLEIRNTKGDWSGAVLVPLGTINKIAASADEVRTMDLANGRVTYGDGSTGTACEPVEGERYRIAWYAWNKASTCPGTWPMKVGAVTASTVLASGQFAVYALGTLQPGALSGDPLYVTLNADPINTGAPIAKPSSIIVSGLNCSVQVTNVGGAGVTGAGSPNVHVNWGELNADTLPAGSTAASAAIALTTTCSGTNSSDPDAQTNVATAFRAGPGAIADASGFIRENDITGYYLTLNQNLGSCDASQAVTGGTIGHHYEPGATGTVSTETVVASLCSDGTSAALGVHNINVVADLVNR